MLPVLLLPLLPLALAADHEFDFGGEDNWGEAGWAANCFTSDDGVQVTEVQVYARSSKDMSVAFSVWYENQSSGAYYTGSAINEASARITSRTGDWVSSGPVNWDTSRVSDRVCIGFYSPSCCNSADPLEYTVKRTGDPLPAWATEADFITSGSTTAVGSIEFPDDTIDYPGIYMKLTLDEPDDDGDGYDVIDDCDDANPDAFPGATEVAGNGVDEDCDGADLADDGGDGTGTKDGKGKGCATAPAVPSTGLLIGTLLAVGVRRRAS